MISLYFTRFLMSFLASAALIGLVLLLKGMLKNHISVTWQYNMRYLFVFILTVLFVPARLFDFVSIINLFFGNIGANGDTAANLLSPNKVNITGGIDWLQDFTLSVNRSTPEYLGVIFVGIWLSGVFAYALYTFIGYQKLRRIKRTFRIVENKAFEDVSEQCKKRLGIRHKLMFRQRI